MIKRVLNTAFDFFWWMGFIIAIGIVFIIKLGLLENTFIVLLYGLTHMIVLTIFGLKAISEGKSNIDIGHRISTMGYLHTLIGTTVALILASNHNSDGQNILNQMDLIITPIGSALVTSIIGWAIGTEMERTIHGTKEETIVDNALNNLSKDITYLGKELKRSTKKWMNSIENTIDGLENSTESLESKFEKTLMVSSTKLETDSKILMNKYFASFDHLFQQLDNQITTTQNNFDHASTDATKVMTNLIVAFESIFQRMDDHARRIEKNFDTLGTKLDESTLETDKAINQFTDSFQKLFNTMNDYSNNMQKDFEESTNNAKTVMDKLALSFDTIFTQIGKVSTQWEAHIKDMRSFANGSNMALSNLLTNSKKVANEIEQVAKGMPNSAQILREVDSILEVLRVIKENDLP